MDFVTFEDALKKLSVTPERLNQLREDGQLRAYRDGASWKFRSDEIERMAHEGVPEESPPSDIGLPRPEELSSDVSFDSLPDLDELGLADELTLEPSDVEPAPRDESELEIELAGEGLDDTVTAPAGDVLEHLEEPSDPSDSILLSDETLGESAPAPPSTIIGRKELSSKDADLELVTDDDLESGSDVQLTAGAGASNVLHGGVAGSGVLDDDSQDSKNKRAFEELEELEIDLAAESSRVLNPQEAAELQEKVSEAKLTPAAPDSDLELADLEIAADDEGTDPVPAEMEQAASKSSKAASSDLELATDEDDFVLAESGGSDITLDSADSGINLVSPSDSGLALDDIPLEIGGSAILDSLSGGPAKAKAMPESDISLVASDSLVGKGPAPKVQTDNDFQLTPMGDGDEEESSSQVIAVEAGFEDLGDAEGGMLGDDAFSEEGAAGGDFGDAGVDEFAAAGYAVAAPRAEGDYGLWNILGLGSVAVLLLFTTMVSLDLVRNIWSWNNNLTLNDSLLEGILGLFGLR
jgi:hypothetical protein